jgi:hypothetical protein
MEIVVTLTVIHSLWITVSVTSIIQPVSQQVPPSMPRRASRSR